jgi:hypothetical protein
MRSDTAGERVAQRDVPTFELHSRFDDSIDPDEITIFPADAEMPTTQWLTADASYAVPIDEIR